MVSSFQSRANDHRHVSGEMMKSNRLKSAELHSAAIANIQRRSGKQSFPRTTDSRQRTNGPKTLPRPSTVRNTPNNGSSGWRKSRKGRYLPPTDRSGQGPDHLRRIYIHNNIVDCTSPKAICVSSDDSWKELNDLIAKAVNSCPRRQRNLRCPTSYDGWRTPTPHSVTSSRTETTENDAGSRLMPSSLFAQIEALPSANVLSTLLSWNSRIWPTREGRQDCPTMWIERTHVSLRPQVTALTTTPTRTSTDGNHIIADPWPCDRMKATLSNIEGIKWKPLVSRQGRDVRQANHHNSNVHSPIGSFRNRKIEDCIGRTVSTSPVYKYILI